MMRSFCSALHRFSTTRVGRHWTVVTYIAIVSLLFVSAAIAQDAAPTVPEGPGDDAAQDLRGGNTRRAAKVSDRHGIDRGFG